MPKKNSNKPTQYCKLYLARHGESEGNVLGIIQGHTDFPLTTRGKDQAAILARALEKVSFAAVYSSDLSRAKDTAAAVANQKQLVVKTTALLRERHFGEFENEATVASQRELIELLKVHESIVTSERFQKKLREDIESDAEVVARFILFLREVAVAYANQNILVVSHSGMIRALLIHLGVYTYQDFERIKIPNASYIVLESDGIDFFVKELVGIQKIPLAE